MSSSSDPTMEQSTHQSQDRCGGGWCKRANWSGMNIAAMVLGFVVFWPLGLVMLYWIFSGRSVREMPKALRHQWSKVSTHWHGDGRESPGHASDNSVFNAFQQTQYDRIREIKDEIKARSRRFKDFRADAKRRADEEEFNRFMSEAPTPDNN